MTIGGHRDEIAAAHMAPGQTAARLRHIANRRIAAHDRLRQFTRIAPLANGTSPSTARISVVLPAPFGPSTPINSPGSTLKLVSRKIVRPPSSSVTCSSSSAGAMARR